MGFRSRETPVKLPPFTLLGYFGFVQVRILNIKKARIQRIKIMLKTVKILCTGLRQKKLPSDKLLKILNLLYCFGKSRPRLFPESVLSNSLNIIWFACNWCTIPNLPSG